MRTHSTREHILEWENTFYRASPLTPGNSFCSHKNTFYKRTHSLREHILYENTSYRKRTHSTERALYHLGLLHLGKHLIMVVKEFAFSLHGRHERIEQHRYYHCSDCGNHMSTKPQITSSNKEDRKHRVLNAHLSILCFECISFSRAHHAQAHNYTLLPPTAQLYPPTDSIQDQNTTRGGAGVPLIKTREIKNWKSKSSGGGRSIPFINTSPTTKM